MYVGFEKQNWVEIDFSNFPTFFAEKYANHKMQ
jgi:hypothetical protein